MSLGCAATLLLLVAAPVAPEEASRRVIAGRPEYKSTGLKTFFMGNGYRALWVTPVDFPLLDLASFAGGLKPVRQVGSMQSIGLALSGGDGKSYTFRTTDKDPTRILPPEWKDTVPAKVFQDSTTANHPGVGFVVPPLAEAAGIPHTTPRYVFMPDDPALGEFRATFGGRPGTIEEFPQAAESGGFAGATEILSTRELWQRWLDGGARIDASALLRARIFDLWIGDWDRHGRQWRWLRRATGQPFEPLPEDRDQAFSRYGGLLMGMARATHPRFMDFSERYENFDGFMEQSNEVDRWLLSGLGRDAFEAAAREIQARMADAVIEDAVKRLPKEWYDIDGARLAAALVKRREALPQAAAEYYRRLNRKVDVHGTDGVELVRAARSATGHLDLELRSAGGAEPFFRRTFDPRETDEVRVYLYGGDDQVASEGRTDGRILLRVVAGPGADALDDSKAGGTHLHDFEQPGAVTPGPGTRQDREPWQRTPLKQETPWLEWRDWGSRTIPAYQVWWEPDPGVVLAAGFRRQSWGFRKFPYASLQAVQLQFSTGRQAFKLNYDGEFRRANSSLYWVVDAQASALENLNYFGQGNTSAAAPPEGQDKSFFDADSDTYRLSVGPRWAASKSFELFANAEAQWTRTPPDQQTFIGGDQPYGTGDFGQLELHAGMDLDTRGHPVVGSLGDQFSNEDGKPARSGVRLKLDGYYMPKAWDVESDFGGLDASLRGYLVGRHAMLAARVGGQRVYGEYPWFESAFLGGSRNLRAYRKNRFAGESALHASLEARAWLFRGRLIAPGRWGIFGLADVGRVFLDGDTSDKWHPAYGGGIFFQMLTLNSVFHASVSHGDEGTRVHVKYGFGF
jgi:hypothetical protein